MPAHPRTVTEPSREIDVIHETDVLVVGSGPGGLAAALAASRAGVRVALVERFGCFGGSITTVGVEGFAWYRREQTVDAGGIGWEFEQRAKEMGAAVPESQSLSYELDSEGFKLVADRLVEEAGIHAMLHRQFVAPLMDGDTIIGIVTESKAGREAILARRVVDATGDAGGRAGPQDTTRGNDGGLGDVPPRRCRQGGVPQGGGRGPPDVPRLGGG
jgi:flavin-dependent dehydrogenase